MTTLTRRLLATVTLTVAAAVPAHAAESFPARPVRIIVNTAPGGLTDVTTRLLAQRMSEILNQSFIVENRAGGDGLIGIRAVKTAPADGYTLLGSAGTFAFQTVLKADPGYELKDFTGVGMMGRSPFLVVVEAGQPDKTFAQFVARAKASPDKVSYASAGVGTAPHLAMEMLMQAAGFRVMHVPYKGNGAAMPDVMSGRVTTILEAYGSSSGKIKAGQLRALAVTSAQRLAVLPNVPTVAESAPGYSYYTWLVITAPAATPKDVVLKLSEALKGAVNTPAIRERYRDDGVETVDLTPDQLNAYMAREVEKVAKLAADLNIPKQ